MGDKQIGKLTPYYAFLHEVSSFWRLCTLLVVFKIKVSDVTGMQK